MNIIIKFAVHFAQYCRYNTWSRHYRLMCIVMFETPSIWMFLIFKYMYFIFFNTVTRHRVPMWHRNGCMFYRAFLVFLVPGVCCRLPAVLMDVLRARDAAPVPAVAPVVLLCAGCVGHTLLPGGHGGRGVWNPGRVEGAPKDDGPQAEVWEGNDAVGRCQLIRALCEIPTELPTKHKASTTTHVLVLSLGHMY